MAEIGLLPYLHNMKKRFNLLITIIICAFVLALSVSFIALPDKAFSGKENRSLAQFQKPTVYNITSGAFTQNFGKYFADQFPMRDAFITVKAYSELILGKRENNGVIKCGDTLIARPKSEEMQLKENLQIVSDFSKSQNIQTVVAALPRSVDVFSEILPASYPTESDKALWDEYFTLSKDYNLIAPDLYSPLCESNEYYRTDHHYNSHGAYLTYSLLGEALGYSPKEKSYFNIQAVTDEFCGTSMRSSGFYFTKKDKIELYRYDSDDSYTITADGESISLYDFSKLDATDKYAVFLGGNHARVDIKSGENRDKLLVIRDSFADSLAPFLSLHFDLVMVDLRYYNDNVRELAVSEGISKVLLIECMSELSTTNNLSYLSIPLGE